MGTKGEYSGYHVTGFHRCSAEYLGQENNKIFTRESKPRTYRHKI
jgi:hypothetical protein